LGAPQAERLLSNVCGKVASSGPDLTGLAERAVRGELVTAISGAYPLSEAATAHRVVEAGHARGKLVLTVG
jgi:NADPH:quinone reductase-like Zn-dependent oxidoreductase